MKIGSRLACDKCGRIESPKLRVLPNPNDQSKHLCETCKQKLYYQNIEAVAKERDSTRML
ncbi:MAG: hypothetical protein ACFFAJ_14430 [Candidatus Hodarchaeota archaeon]